MVRSAVITIVLWLGLAGTSVAQNCSAYPNTLTNGTNADASQVMANFTAVLNCVNALSAPKGHIFGLTLSNNAGDAANDIDIAPGEAASTETNHVRMSLASALTKRLDAAWAVGSGNGGLDTGTVTNGTYHVWLIQRSDTGVVDALFSVSPISPSMPANYTRKRRIGSILRQSGAILAFRQDGDQFTWATLKTDRSSTAEQQSFTSLPLTVPTGIIVQPLMTGYQLQSSGTGQVSTTVANASDAARNVWVAATAFAFDWGYWNLEGTIFTDTSGQIAYQVDFSGGSPTLLAHVIQTRGWIDTRGRLN